jgi:adenine-specific DNA-methyltransferase
MNNFKLMDLERIKEMSKEEIVDFIESKYMNSNDNGISLNYSGKSEPWEIVKKVKPKFRKNAYTYPNSYLENKNLLIEGENLSAMVSLYKYRGQVDLILTDPPYNTGKDFRYNDSWDTNPDDPNLGNLVSAEDGSKHSKWLRFMAPRLYIMKEMLKPNGVIAICIDHRELYRLGILMDEIFGEKNRIGIINWQKTYSPKSGAVGLSTATEYVLIYAKNISITKTKLETRTSEMNNRYKNPDADIKGEWKSSDAIAKDASKNGTFGIQSPFTGVVYYPKNNEGHWGQGKDTVLQEINKWGVEYEMIPTEKKYLVKNKKQSTEHTLFIYAIKGWDFNNEKNNETLLKQSQNKATSILNNGNWPKFYWGLDGKSGLQMKSYLTEVKQGKVPMTFWSSDDFEDERTTIVDSISWEHNESGHSQAGINELDSIIGKGHRFDTVKPLKLMKKIITLWCPPEGLILDPFAGSGTTAHACLELNYDLNYDRKFILIEQGNTEKNDLYAETLTAQRIKNVIDGNWVIKKKNKNYPKINSGFTYQKLDKKVDKQALKDLAKEEMIDILISSYWNNSEKAKSFIFRTNNETSKYLFGKNNKNEGFYLVWDGKAVVDLTREIYKSIIKESNVSNLSPKYHIYATSMLYDSEDIAFYKIPNKVLEQLGFNENEEGDN